MSNDARGTRLRPPPRNSDRRRGWHPDADPTAIQITHDAAKSREDMAYA